MKINIDWSNINTEEDFYSLFLPQVKAPEWHGHNLNALNDSIVTGDINGLEPPYTIININSAKAPELLTDFQRAVIEIFTDSVLEYEGNELIVR